jgi:hypothetical protein
LNSSFRPVFLSPSEEVPCPAKLGNLRLELRLPQVYDIPKTDEQEKCNGVFSLKLENVCTIIVIFMQNYGIFREKNQIFFIDKQISRCMLI